MYTQLQSGNVVTGELIIIAPFDGSQDGNNFIDHHPTKPEPTHEKRAIAKQQSKSNLHREACRVKNCVFVPFIMYTTGKIHEQGLRFLKKMARNASETFPSKFFYSIIPLKVLNFACTLKYCQGHMFKGCV